MFKKLFIIVASFSLVACANLFQHHRDACYPGSTCYEDLPTQAQNMQREKWLRQKQMQIDNTRQNRINSEWAVKPITSY